MSEVTPATPEAPEPVEPTESAFTQSDVDRIVKERLERFSKKFADYDDLKAQAEKSSSLEQQVADTESKYQKAELKALRATVAADHGISKEDRELFLTGDDETKLTDQAKRLVERERERQQVGNVAPFQGHKPENTGDSEMQEFRNKLFNPAAE